VTSADPAVTERVQDHQVFVELSVGSAKPNNGIGILNLKIGLDPADEHYRGVDRRPPGDRSLRGPKELYIGRRESMNFKRTASRHQNRGNLHSL